MKNTIVCYDLETSGTDPWVCQPLQIAAIAIHGATLEIKPNSSFNSMIRPQSFAELSDDNINFHCKVRNITKDQFIELLTKAPPLESVINNFVQYLGIYNFRKNKFTAPVACGHNIRRYDNIIWDRLRQQYKISDDEGFHCRDTLDLLDIAFLWFEGQSRPEKYNLDALRTFFGLSKDNAHDALQDVTDTAKIVTRFLKLHRSTAQKVRFEGALSK